MSDFYNNIKENTALPLIKEFGKTISLYKKTSNSNFDPVTGSYPDATYTLDSSGYCVQTELKIKDLQNTLIKQTDKRLLAIDINEPISGDRVIVDSIEYNVIWVDEVKPGSINILYKIYVRK